MSLILVSLLKQYNWHIYLISGKSTCLNKSPEKASITYYVSVNLYGTVCPE